MNVRTKWLMAILLVLTTTSLAVTLQHQQMLVGVNNFGMVLGGMGAAQSMQGAMAANGQAGPGAFQIQAGGAGAAGQAWGLGSQTGFAQNSGVSGGQNQGLAPFAGVGIQQQGLNLSTNQVMGKTGPGLGGASGMNVAGAGQLQHGHLFGGSLTQGSVVTSMQGAKVMGGPGSTVIVGQNAGAQTYQFQMVR